MTSAAIDPIEHDGAVLRMLDAADLPTTLAWRNHPDSRRWFLTTELIAPEDHRRWFAQYLERDDDYMFIVEQDGVALAQVSLSRIRRDAGEAEFGRLLVDPEARGRGLSHLATRLCLLAAARLGLRRIHLEVKADNARAIRAYERAGFEAQPDRSGDVLRMAVNLP